MPGRDGRRRVVPEILFGNFRQTLPARRLVARNPESFECGGRVARSSTRRMRRRRHFSQSRVKHRAALHSHARSCASVLAWQDRSRRPAASQIRSKNSNTTASASPMSTSAIRRPTRTQGEMASATNRYRLFHDAWSSVALRQHCRILTPSPATGPRGAGRWRQAVASWENCALRGVRWPTCAHRPDSFSAAIACGKAPRQRSVAAPPGPTARPATRDLRLLGDFERALFQKPLKPCMVEMAAIHQVCPNRDDICFSSRLLVLVRRHQHASFRFCVLEDEAVRLNALAGLEPQIE